MDAALGPVREGVAAAKQACMGKSKLPEALQRFGSADAVPGEEIDEEAPKRLKSRVALCPALYGLPTIKMK